MIEDRIEATCPPFAGAGHGRDEPGAVDAFTLKIVDLAEAGAIDGLLLPDELQELCRAVLDHVERNGICRC